MPAAPASQAPAPVLWGQASAFPAQDLGGHPPRGQPLSAGLRLPRPVSASPPAGCPFPTGAALSRRGSSGGNKRGHGWTLHPPDQPGGLELGTQHAHATRARAPDALTSRVTEAGSKRLPQRPAQRLQVTVTLGCGPTAQGWRGPLPNTPLVPGNCETNQPLKKLLPLVKAGDFSKNGNFSRAENSTCSMRKGLSK